MDTRYIFCQLQRIKVSQSHTAKQASRNWHGWTSSFQFKVSFTFMPGPLFNDEVVFDAILRAILATTLGLQ
jgi:hypothetical protein